MNNISRYILSNNNDYVYFKILLGKFNKFICVYVKNRKNYSPFTLK